ncbi:unnamed protein product [Moneuplotes crassus]|uniref:Uncharacterized protein n=1 Tax=Euplotes crassus TaxID=5936 RepID=A0AAD1UNA8_EUPCR|nr:unnamed protein product [Moneuplotes crassus]
MSKQRIETNNISDFLGTSIESTHQTSKHKHTYLDSTAITNKLHPDTTLTSSAIGDATSSRENNISCSMLQELHQTQLADLGMSTDSVDIIVPLQREYDQPDYKLLDQHDDDTDELESDQVVANPKKIENWLSLTLKGAIKKGLLKETPCSASHKTLSSEQANKPTKKVDVLKKFGIDRATLNSNGIDDASATRVYRALYVYSLGFHQLIQEALQRGTNRNLLLATIWKVYSVLLQYVGKTEYATMVSNLANAYQMDVISLEQQMSKQKDHYTQHKQQMTTEIHRLNGELYDTQQKLQNSTEMVGTLTDENARLQSAIDAEKQLRTHFESRFANIEGKLNQKATDCKIAEEELQKVMDEVKELKESLTAKEDTIASLRKDKCTNERLYHTKESECAGLKEILLSKRAVITQRDNRVKELVRDIAELKRSINDNEKEISDQKIKNSVIQSKIMDGKNEVQELQSNFDKIKRINAVLEDKIANMNEKYDEINQKYSEIDAKCISLTEVEKYLRKDNQDYRTKNQELEKSLEFQKEKSDGLEIKIKIAVEKYDLIKKDYDSTIKSLEEINRQRNKLEDKVMIGEKRAKEATQEIEQYKKNLYNLKAHSEGLQLKLRDLEEEFQTVCRRETANAEMSEIQIASLENKYLGMFKKYEEEQKKKNEWIRTYRRRHKEHLENEVKLKKAEGEFQEQITKNVELQSDNEAMKSEIYDWEKKYELLKNEKIDLLTKMDRKKNEMDSLKLTHENLEKHNSEYIKRLRDINRELLKKSGEIENIKQMEVEDLTTQCLNYELKVTKYKKNFLEAKNQVYQASCDVKQAESKLSLTLEKFEVMKTENIDLKSRLESIQTENTVNKTKIIKMATFEEKVKLLTNLGEQYKETINSLKQENKELEQEIGKVKGELKKIEDNRPPSFGLKKVMVEKKVQTDHKITSEIKHSLKFGKKSSVVSILSYNKSCKDLTEISKIKTARNSMINRSMSNQTLLPHLYQRELPQEETKTLEKTSIPKPSDQSRTQRDVSQSIINLPEANITPNFQGWKVEHTHGKKSRNFKGPIKAKVSHSMRNMLRHAYSKSPTHRYS